MYVYNSLKVAGVEVLSAFPTTELFEGRTIYIDGVTYTYNAGTLWTPIGGAQTSVDANTDVAYTSTPPLVEAFGYAGSGSQTNVEYDNQTDKYGFTIAGPATLTNISAIKLPLRFNSLALGDLDGNAFQLEIWTANPSFLPATLIAKSDIIRVYDQTTGSENKVLTFTFESPVSISSTLSPNGYSIFVTQISTVSTNTNLQFQFPIMADPNGSTVGYYNFIWEYGLGWEIYPAQRYPLSLSFQTQTAGNSPDRWKILGLGWDGLIDIDFFPPGQTLPPLQAGRFLFNDGSLTSWQVVYPDPSTETGNYLQSQGANTIWAPVFPNQTGQTGKVLTTDGVNPLWVPAGTGVLPPPTGQAGKFLGNDGVNEFWLTVWPDTTAHMGEYLSNDGAGGVFWAPVLPVSDGTNVGWFLQSQGGSVGWQEVYPPPTGGTTDQILKSTGTGNTAWVPHYPDQTGQNGKFLQTSGTGDPSWVSIPVQGDLPDPVGHTGEILGSNGTVAYWGTVASFMPVWAANQFLTEDGTGNLLFASPFPDQSAAAGLVLGSNGTTVQWVAGASGLPDQTGQTGKYLTTDGTTASWGAVSSLTLSDITGAPLTRSLTTFSMFTVDTSSGAYNLTLPSSPSNGSQVVIKDRAGLAGTNPILIQPATGTIDGQASVTIVSAYASVSLISNGTNWFIS